MSSIADPVWCRSCYPQSFCRGRSAKNHVCNCKGISSHLCLAQDLWLGVLTFTHITGTIQIRAFYEVTIFARSHGIEITQYCVRVWSHFKWRAALGSLIKTPKIMSRTSQSLCGKRTFNPMLSYETRLASKIERQQPAASSSDFPTKILPWGKYFSGPACASSAETFLTFYILPSPASLS